MKTARLLVLGVALAAGLGAAFIVGGSKPTQLVKEIVPTPVVSTDDVLVAARELPYGTVLQDNDLQWQSWPKDSIPPSFVRKSAMPNAVSELRGTITRTLFATTEPLQQDRLVRANGSGFMSALLSTGNRALAIPIDGNGGTTAGNFILPNDRVDVIQTHRDEQAIREGAGDSLISETIARNIRVLAIGQNIQEKNNERVIGGTTATLEVTPRQAEILALAQRTAGSTLSLALRSMADSKAAEEEATARAAEMTIVRNGVAMQARSH
jgi:pilus assembly protein CpaB